MAAKPRILAFHGFRTSAQTFEAQVTIAALSKAFQESAEVVYLDAPHPASGQAYPEVLQFFTPPFFEWWNAVEKSDGKVVGSGGDRPQLEYRGAPESLEYVHRYMQQHGPFDGLMGFSQGASLAATILRLQETGGGFTDVPPIKFCILIAGGRIRDPAYHHLFSTARQQEQAAPQAAQPASSSSNCSSEPSSRAACFMIGNQDPHRGWTEALLPCFKDPLVLRADAGHQVPRLSQDQQQQLVAFIRRHTQYGL